MGVTHPGHPPSLAGLHGCSLLPAVPHTYSAFLILDHWGPKSFSLAGLCPPAVCLLPAGYSLGLCSCLPSPPLLPPHHCSWLGSPLLLQLHSPFPNSFCVLPLHSYPNFLKVLDSTLDHLPLCVPTPSSFIMVPTSSHNFSKYTSHFLHTLLFL